MILIMVFAGGCGAKPEKASDLYSGCVFTVKNGDIISYGVYVEVKNRVSDFSVMNLRTYDEAIADEVIPYQADETKIYYRTETVYNACHQDGYGEQSYFMSATRPLYKLPEDKYRRLVSKLESAVVQVRLSDSTTNRSYTFNTVLPLAEADESSGS